MASPEERSVHDDREVCAAKTLPADQHTAEDDRLIHDELRIFDDYQ